MLGTRFLLANENNVFQSYQNSILSAKETDTIVTNVFSVRYARCIENKFVKEYLLALIIYGLAAGHMAARWDIVMERLLLFI